MDDNRKKYSTLYFSDPRRDETYDPTHVRYLTLNSMSYFKYPQFTIFHVWRSRREAAFVESFIVKSEKENMEIKYEIPRLEIASIIDDRITLRLKESEIDENH